MQLVPLFTMNCYSNSQKELTKSNATMLRFVTPATQSPVSHTLLTIFFRMRVKMQ